ncbi:hypothetical protein [Acetobacter sp. P5B1]|uniref:hypothetical protein n=1 Tax=Acetobacter sp. P5B1 TaxID=2762620 RepID=UPI001C05B7EF|nr:hypothetical protein [Acetobacter sp. P5B1]
MSMPSRHVKQILATVKKRGWVAQITNGGMTAALFCLAQRRRVTAGQRATLWRKCGEWRRVVHCDKAPPALVILGWVVCVLILVFVGG